MTYCHVNQASSTCQCTMGTNSASGCGANADCRLIGCLRLKQKKQTKQNKTVLTILIVEVDYHRHQQDPGNWKGIDRERTSMFPCCWSIYLSVQPVYLSVYLLIFLSIYLSVCRTFVSICRSVCLSDSTFICLCLSICCLSVFLTISGNLKSTSLH